MPGDLLSRPLIKIAAYLHAKRVTAQELVEAAISDTGASASGCTPTRYGRRSRPARSLRRPMPCLPRG